VYLDAFTTHRSARDSQSAADAYFVITRNSLDMLSTPLVAANSVTATRTIQATASSNVTPEQIEAVETIFRINSLVIGGIVAVSAILAGAPAIAAALAGAASAAIGYAGAAATYSIAIGIFIQGDTREGLELANRVAFDVAYDRFIQILGGDIILIL